MPSITPTVVVALCLSALGLSALAAPAPVAPDEGR